MKYSWKIYASIVIYFLICILTAISDAGSLQETQEGLWIIERLSNLNKLLVLIAAFPASGRAKKQSNNLYRSKDCYVFGYFIYHFFCRSWIILDF